MGSATGLDRRLVMADNVPASRDDSDAVAREILDTISAVHNELRRGAPVYAPPALDSSISSDIGLDSLARVELGARLDKQFSIALPERVLFDAETPRDLLGAVMKAGSGATFTTRAVHTTATNTMSADVALPDAATTLNDMLEWHAAQQPERTHIRFYDDYSDGAVLTYGELVRHAQTMAACLQHHGLLPGERVALMLPGGREYFVAFFAAVLAGGVPVPIYPPVRRQQLEDHLRRQRRILDNSRAAMLVTNTEAMTVARLLTGTVSSLRQVLDIAALNAPRAAFEAVRPAPTDTAFLQYTSGSTGDPKGVVLSHANLLANIRADGHGMGVTSEDVFVSWLPLYHDMGLIGAWLGSLYHAVPLVVMSPLTFLSRPERWLWAISRYGGTLSAAPNFAYELCLRRIDDDTLTGLDLSRWRIAANGAEAISAVTMEAFCSRFARYGFQRKAMFPVYGLAECSVGLAFTPLGRGPRIDHIDRDVLARAGEARPVAPDHAHALAVVASGQPLPRHEIRIVDSTNRELPERVEGRIQFRGPSATTGYFGNPAASAALIVDGWLESGDRGYIAGGDIHITGRSKDIIIRAGRNLYPAELEDAIGDLDGVRKGHVAVFGVADPGAGTERLVVLVESRRRHDDARARLRERINTLANDLVGGPVDDIVFAPPNTVLRTSSGKIRRNACRALYVDGRIGATALPPWLQITRLVFAAAGPQLRRASAAIARTGFALRAWSALAVPGLCVWLLTWLPAPARVHWQIARALARGACRLAGIQVTVTDATHLPADGTACIVVANHQSYLDGIVMFASLSRPPRFLVKGELGQSPLLARPLRRLGALFIERFDAAASIAGLDDARAALADGALLVVFPEGTFKRMPGLLPFHLGAFHSAVASGAALIPASLHGTRSILRAGTWLPRRGAISLAFGSALIADPEQTAWAQALELRDGARAFMLTNGTEPDLAHESNAVE